MAFGTAENCITASPSTKERARHEQDPFPHRQIVPSSNTTMETEIPAMLRGRELSEPERFSFHSARMRMMKVTKEELAAMDV